MKLYYAIRKALNLASLMLDRLPTNDDTLFGKAVKVFSMVDAVRISYFGERSPMDSYIKEHDLEQVTSYLWARLFHEKKILGEYPVESLDIDEGVILKKVTINKDHMIVFIYESSDMDDPIDYFYTSKGLKLDSLVASLWKDYPNGIYVESVQGQPKFSPLKKRDFDISPQSLLKIPLYKDKVGVCILAVGQPGCGKSLFVSEVSGPEGKLLKFDHTFVREQSVESLLFLIKTIMPRTILLDDFDRIGMNARSAKYLYLLEILQELNITTYLTANDPSKIDSALLRTERIDTVIKFMPPSVEERVWFLNQCKLDQKTIDRLANESTAGFTQSDMSALVGKIDEYGVESALEQINEIRSILKSSLLSKEQQDRELSLLGIDSDSEFVEDDDEMSDEEIAEMEIALDEALSQPGVPFEAIYNTSNHAIVPIPEEKPKRKRSKPL